MKKESLYIVMPAYNEEANIRAVVETWYRIPEGVSEDSRLVIADSGSTDGTHDILVQLKERYPQLEILTDTEKQHGPKLIALYNYAIEHGADYIFQTDSDGQTNPDEFDSFWQLRLQYDAILGHRKVRGDGRARDFVEKVVCFLLKIYFGVNVPDANAPFRLMKSSVVSRYIDWFDADYNLPNIMLTTFFAYYKERLIFKQISFRPRLAGTNSINIKKIMSIGWKALGEFDRFKKQMKRGV